MQAMALYRTSIGKKVLMALTGAIWIGYVILHMYGNLKAFVGPAYYNEYAAGLRSLGAPIFGHLQLLTLARIVLVLAIFIHVWAALMLYLQAKGARSTNYAVKRVIEANYASRTMRFGGVVLALFLLFHLAQLTWGTRGINNDFIRGDPYYNLVSIFQSPVMTAIYLVALVALGFHLFHATWSMFQTLGLNSRRYDSFFHGLAWILAIGVPLGFAAVPIAILFGVLS